MAADPTVDLATRADELNERFAVLVDDGLPEILRTFAWCLREQYGIISEDGACPERARAMALDVFSDVVCGVRAGRVRIDDRGMPAAWAIVRAGWDECRSPGQRGVGDDLIVG